MVDGKPVTNDVAPFEKDDRTFVPIRFIAETMGFFVDYDEVSKVVTISDTKPYFNTIDECALDFGMYTNCASIALYRELGAYVFKNDKGYYWTGLKIGKKDRQELYIDANLARQSVAILHTHGGTAGGAANNHFSTGDKKVSKKYSKPIYMCSPVGEQWCYTPNNHGGEVNHIGFAPIDWKFEDFCKSINKRDYNMSKELFCNYFSGKYKYIADVMPGGYILDYYNRMFLANDKY